MPRRDSASRLREAIDERRFDDPAVISILDEMTVHELADRFGEPLTAVTYAESTWKPGSGRPLLADDDPAVMQAIGMCATNRLRNSNLPLSDAVHPGPCDWCDYPIGLLLEACSWAVWASRFVTAELLIWHGEGHSSYVRSGRHDVYENPRWAAWWVKPAADRRYEVEQVRRAA